MPLNPRKRLIEIHGQAVNDVNRCLANMLTMHDAYQEQHPDRAAELQMMAEALILWRETFEQFRRERM